MGISCSVHYWVIDIYRSTAHGGGEVPLLQKDFAFVNWTEWRASLGDNSLNVTHLCTFMVCTETLVAFVPDCFSQDNCTDSSLGRWNLCIQNRGQVCFLVRMIKIASFLGQKLTSFACLTLQDWGLQCNRSSSAVTQTHCVQRLCWDPHHPLCGIPGHRKGWKYEAVLPSVLWTK